MVAWERTWNRRNRFRPWHGCTVDRDARGGSPARAHHNGPGTAWSPARDTGTLRTVNTLTICSSIKPSSASWPWPAASWVARPAHPASRALWAALAGTAPAAAGQAHQAAPEALEAPVETAPSGGGAGAQALVEAAPLPEAVAVAAAGGAWLAEACVQGVGCCPGCWQLWMAGEAGLQMMARRWAADDEAQAGVLQLAT